MAAGSPARNAIALLLGRNAIALLLGRNAFAMLLGRNANALLLGRARPRTQEGAVDEGWRKIGQKDIPLE